LSFLSGPFTTAYQSYNIDMGLGFYDKEANDCDNFSSGAAHFMNFLHYQTPNRKFPNAGIAFGVFDYKRKDGTYHSINIAIVVSNEKIKVVFYEPQTYSIVGLTNQEIWSCIRWHF
jgi:hypothetical protein